MAAYPYVISGVDCAEMYQDVLAAGLPVDYVEGDATSITVYTTRSLTGPEVTTLNGVVAGYVAQQVGSTGLFTITGIASAGTVPALIMYRVNSSGTVPDTFGVSMLVYADSNGATYRNVGNIHFRWKESDDAIRKGEIIIQAADSAGAYEVARFQADGVAKFSVFGATPFGQLSNPDLGTLATSFGFASGTPTFAAAHLTWSTTKVPLANGGTNADLSGTGGASQYLKQSSGGAAITVGTIPAGDYPDFVAAGASHATGGVPDPGATSHSHFPYNLGDDGNWHARSGEMLGTPSQVDTAETTTSTTAVELTTTQQITFTLDVVADVVVHMYALASHTVAGTRMSLELDVDGAVTRVGSTQAPSGGAQAAAMCCERLVTGLSAASHTIKFKFSTGAATATFANRLIHVRRA